MTIITKQNKKNDDSAEKIHSTKNKLKDIHYHEAMGVLRKIETLKPISTC
jgi:hypothetical protein